MNSKVVRILGIAWLVALLPFLAACGTENGSGATSSGASGTGKPGTQVQTGSGSYTNLKPSELKTMLDSKDFFLVDTHIPPEGRLPETDLRVPFDQVDQQIAKFPSDKNAKIVLTCRSGRMSSEASQTLVGLGYTNVYNLDGGMVAWKQAGYEIIPEGK